MMKPSKRFVALERIRIDVATNGKTTQEGMRAYTENRISYAAFKAAVDKGRAQYEARVKGEVTS